MRYLRRASARRFFVPSDTALVTLHKIKDAVLARENVSEDTPAKAVRISAISLPDSLKNVHPSKRKFPPHVPDVFPDETHKAAKSGDLAKDAAKID